MHIILSKEFYIVYSIRYDTENQRYYKLAYLVENGTTEHALKAKAITETCKEIMAGLDINQPI